MIPKCITGTDISGLARYVLGEKRGTDKDGQAPGEASRVAWMSGSGFGFNVESRERADLARRLMEFDAANQNSRTRKCEKTAVHLVLSWRTGETPTRADMEAAAHEALASIGMSNARALFVAHGDEDHAHLHIVASRLNPATRKAYDLKGDYLKLSTWAQGYEERHGGIQCSKRVGNNRLRAAIDERDAMAVADALTAQRATFTEKGLDRTIAKQIKPPEERASFVAEILAQPYVVALPDRTGDPARFTTQAVLAEENEVRRRALALAANSGPRDVREATRDAVLVQNSTIRDDQMPKPPAAAPAPQQPTRRGAPQTADERFADLEQRMNDKAKRIRREAEIKRQKDPTHNRGRRRRR
jgi:hypothetical protein